MDAAFRELMPDTVITRPRTGTDDYGQPAYGDAVTHPYCRPVDKVERVRDPKGQEVVSQGYVLMDGSAAVSVTDEIELPDGRKPIVMAVSRPKDESGQVHHSKVSF